MEGGVGFDLADLCILSGVSSFLLGYSAGCNQKTILEEKMGWGFTSAMGPRGWPGRRFPPGGYGFIKDSRFASTCNLMSQSFLEA